MPLPLVTRLTLTLLFAASATACVTSSTIGPRVRSVSAAQRDRDCALLGVVVGTEPRNSRSGIETEAAMTQVRRKVVAAGGNALYVLSNATTGDIRTVTAEALSCRFGNQGGASQFGVRGHSAGRR